MTCCANDGKRSIRLHRYYCMLPHTIRWSQVLPRWRLESSSLCRHNYMIKYNFSPLNELRKKKNKKIKWWLLLVLWWATTHTSVYGKHWTLVSQLWLLIIPKILSLHTGGLLNLWEKLIFQIFTSAWQNEWLIQCRQPIIFEPQTHAWKRSACTLVSVSHSNMGKAILLMLLTCSLRYLSLPG